jgi:hypothetical protein
MAENPFSSSTCIDARVSIVAEPCLPSRCLVTAAVHPTLLRPGAPYSLWTPRNTFFLSNVSRSAKVSKQRDCEIAVKPRGRYPSWMSQSGILKVEGILGGPLPAVTRCTRETKEQRALYLRGFAVELLGVVCVWWRGLRGQYRHCKTLCMTNVTWHETTELLNRGVEGSNLGQDAD